MGLMSRRFLFLQNFKPPWCQKYELSDHEQTLCWKCRIIQELRQSIWAVCARLYTDISNAEQGKEESKEGGAEGEELPVPLEDLEVVRQACDDGLHAAHLVDTNRETETPHLWIFPK